MEVMNAPRLMFRYLGKRNAKSLEVAMELVEMLVPRVARPLVVSGILALFYRPDDE
jgi:hypothetical protein